MNAARAHHARETALFWLVSALPLALIWWFPLLPTQDGPVHLENARLLLEWSDTPLLQQYYEPQPVPTPNTISHLVLGGLLSLFPPAVAERLFATGFLLGLAGAARFFARSLGAPAAAWLVFPFLLSYPFHLGFFGFCYSTALLLVLLGSWLRRRQEPERADVLVLGLLFLLTYVAHPIPFLVGIGVIGLGEVSFAVAARRREGRTPAGRALRILAAAAPALLVLALFGSGQQVESLRWIPWGFRWRSVLLLDAIVSFRPEEWFLSGLLAFLVTVGAAWSLRRWRRLPGAVRLQLAAGVLLLLLALVVPNSLVGRQGTTIAGWLSFRAAFLGWLLFALGTGAAIGRRPWGRRAVPAVGLVVFAGFLVLHVGSYRELVPLLEEQASFAEELPEGSVFLPVAVASRGAGTSAPPPSTKVRPFLHGFSRGAATAAPRIDLGNYQARPGTSFPFVYRPELDPTRSPRVRPSRVAPPFPDPRAYARGPGRVDVILVWGAPDDPATRAVHAWLEEAGYGVAAVSAEGNARAYRTGGD